LPAAEGGPRRLVLRSDVDLIASVLGEDCVLPAHCLWVAERGGAHTLLA
jgi:glycogen operon protein